MSNAMIAAPEHVGAMSVYDRVADPLEFVEKVGMVLAQSGACGCKTPAEGKLVALACLCERKSPFDIGRRYHLMDGKLSIKSDVMLADLRAASGSYKWIDDGKGDGSAVIELTYKGQIYVSSYGMEDAHRAGLVKEKSGWTKNPANMKRARAVSDGMRMIAPEISAGVYTPEENEDISNEAAPVSAAAPTKRATKAEAEARKAELQAQQTAPSAADKPAVQPAPTVVETVATPVTAPAQTATAPAAAAAEESQPSADPAKADADARLAQLCQKGGLTIEQLETALKAKNPSFVSLAALNAEQTEKIVANLTARFGG